MLRCRILGGNFHFFSRRNWISRCLRALSASCCPAFCGIGLFFALSGFVLSYVYTDIEIGSRSEISGPRDSHASTWFTLSEVLLAAPFSFSIELQSLRELRLSRKPCSDDVAHPDAGMVLADVADLERLAWTASV